MADECNRIDKRLPFVQILKKYPILLEKNATPAANALKDVAMSSLINDCKGILTGEELTPKNLRKRINNLKTDFKKKYDKNATGNRPISQKEWEKVFGELLQENSNPTYHEIENAASVGFNRPSQEIPSTSTNAPSDINNVTNNNNVTQASTNAGVPGVNRSITKKKSNNHLVPHLETSETKTMTLHQLQRTVLLEQLKLIRTQQHNEDRKR